MIKKILLTLFLIFGLATFTYGAEPASWDLLDEDCVAIEDWNDSDSGNSVSEVSPASQFRMDCNTAASPNVASRDRDIGSYPAEWTAEIKLYHDALGTLANTDFFKFEMQRDDIRIYIIFDTDGLYVHDGSSNVLILAGVVKYAGSVAWQTWRFVIKASVAASATMDIYLDGELEAADADCSFEASETDGATFITQYGVTTNDMLTHIDYIKSATGRFPLGGSQIIIIQ